MGTGTLRNLKRVLLTATLVAISPLVANSQQNTQPESSAEATTTKDDGGFMDSVRQDEAQAMALADGLASRNGDTLTISYYGKPVISFTDHNKFTCFEEDPCERWYLLGTMPLQFPNGHLASHALVVYDPGEAPKLLIIDQAGTAVWFNGNLSASPDGHFIADGSQRSVHTGPHLQIIDWTSQGHSSGYKVEGIGCQPMTWLDSNNLILRCEQFAAKATYLPDGTWEIVESGIFDKNMDYHEKAVKHPYRNKMTALTYNDTISAYTTAKIRGLKILTQP